MSLRARLLLAAAYLLTVVVVALDVPLALNIDQRVRREFESGVLSNAVLLAARINDDVPKAGTDRAVAPAPPAALTQTVTATARAVRSIRFVVTDRFGRVLADSAGETVVGVLYGTDQRPEFSAALSRPGGQIDIRTRFSETLGQSLLLVTVPVVHQHQAIGVVRASEPTGALRDRVHRIWAGLAAIGVAVVLAGLALAWILATTLARPVRRLEDAAVRLGSGDLDARAEPGGPVEVATLADSFNRMAAALSANIGAQQDFLANASHQLRTPLTGLKLRLEAIETYGGEAAEQARKAGAEADRLNDLVEGLLQLARASSTQTAGGVVDLGQVARAAVDRWSAPAARAGKSLSLDPEPPPADLPIRADTGDLAHVVDNLIENAIRYTPSGTEIHVGASAVDGRARLLVRDTGPGIPDEERDRVFERFYRGANGRHAGPGTGLGLAIVSELVHRWGGRIQLADDVRGGTCFDANFPVATGDDAPGPAVS